MYWHVAAIILLAVYVTPAGADQFYMITQFGNTFLIEPPEPPRPANIIGQTAHLIVDNPPAGMFVATTNHSTTKFTPAQSGMDVTGYGGGTIRFVSLDLWDDGTDYTFRDQPFGAVWTDHTETVMYQSLYMPLASGWNDTHDVVPLVGNSCFGMGGCANNTLGLTPGAHHQYTIHMNNHKRIGLDFGPGTSDDQTYYIHRGCRTCDTPVAIGYGDPLLQREALPNNPAITPHPRGWQQTGTCDISESRELAGVLSRGVTATFTIPPPEHSNASDHPAPDRYAELSILPNSHSACTGIPYSVAGEDNRKYDMCITDVQVTANTIFRYPYTETKRVEDTATGVVISTTTTSGNIERTVTGTCNPPTTSKTAATPTTRAGYRASVVCSGGSAPAAPTDTITTSTYGGQKTTTARTYGSPTAITLSNVKTDCALTINTPQLELDGVMTIRPGLNVYRPPAIPASDNILIILDDAQTLGGTEHIQLFRAAGLGTGPVGPYEFHLKVNQDGIMYDSHRHYGWLRAGYTYNSTHLADMSYVPHMVLAGLPDGRDAAGGFPAGTGRICHGDCFMGPEGVYSGKPQLRTFDDDPTEHTIPSPVKALVYDHHNDWWYQSGLGLRAPAGHISAATLYLVVPFAVDTDLLHIRMYDRMSFDPQKQVSSAGSLPCHLGQGGGSIKFGNGMMSGSGEVRLKAGEAVRIPVLPDMRYVAFIGNNECHWYDISTLPSPLSGVSSGARTIPLYNGTILTGNLAAKHDGALRVNVIADLDAVWQSEMAGVVTAAPANSTWVAPPFHVNLTAVARINGATGVCGDGGVYCSEVVEMVGTTVLSGTPIQPFTPGESYATAPPGPSGVYGLPHGRCYGLESIHADTGGIIVRNVPDIKVRSGDTVSLEVEAVVAEPQMVGGVVMSYRPAGFGCAIQNTTQTITLDVRTLTATLR